MSFPEGTILLTGAAGGIGSGFVNEFLKTPQATSYHAIYLVHPSAQGNLSGILSSRAPVEHKYEIITLDLSNIAEIRKFASSISSRVSSGFLPPIRGLLLVAGGIFTSKETEDGIDYTVNGLEMTFAVNYLSSFLLVLLLVGSMDKSHARIIFISSTTHNPANGSNSLHVKKKEHLVLWKEVETLAKGKAEKVVRGEKFEAAMRRYGTSKFCMNLFMYELQRRLQNDPALSKVGILAMDPGAVAGTDLYHAHTFPFFLYIMLKYVLVPVQKIVVWLFPNGPLRTTQKVGRDLIFACWDEKTLGKYPKALYLDGTIVRDSSPETHDMTKQLKLWEGSLEVLGVKDGETTLGEWR